MTLCKWIDAVGLSCVIALAGAPALAQQPAKGGSLLTSAPGTRLEPAINTSPRETGTVSGKTRDEAAVGTSASGDMRVSESCPPDSENCDAVELPRTGLLTEMQPPHLLPLRYGSLWFSSPSYGGSGGMSISPRVLGEGAGGGSGRGGLTLTPPGITPNPIPGLLPNICLP
jgi:hypothetical protein